MPVGIMSYRSWPLYLEEEAKSDSRIASIKTPYMKEIMKTFTGWLHCAQDADRYLGTDLPRILYAESDLQYTMTNSYFPWQKRSLYKKEYDLVYVNVGEGDWHV